MAYTKQVIVSKTSVVPADARYEYYIADANTPHPGCLACRVFLTEGEYTIVYLQTVTRDVDGNITGRVNAGILTGAELTGLRNVCVKVFDSAALASGYTVV